MTFLSELRAAFPRGRVLTAVLIELRRRQLELG